MLTLSPDQETALKKLLAWYKRGTHQKPYVTLGGYAGTGKSTFIAYFRKHLYAINKDLQVAFVSYTGKAARVLKQKLREQKAISKKDSVSTIHSLIYSPVVNEKQQIVGWKKKDEIKADLIIVDEGSMVDQFIWKHLLSYKIPIIVIGDHGQLPPIKGSFNLMENPDLILDTIHRQALHNPIIGISIQAREHGLIKPSRYSSTVMKFSQDDYEGQEEMQELLSNFDSDTLILCGYNHTRQKLNNHIRQQMGFLYPEPSPGDRVICLRNNHEKEVYNGMLGTIVDIKPENKDWYSAEIDMDEEEEHYFGFISVAQFGNSESLNYTENRSKIMKGDLFDFGYAMTVHKAQGSQAKRVILFEERFKKMNDDEWKRWLYTAVTRAEEELYIFGK